MTLQLIPKSGFLLVKPIAPAKTGLVQLADVYDEPETSGEVVGLAETFRCPHCGESREPDVEVGDVIVFAPNVGDVCEFQGARYLLIPESDVLGVVIEAGGTATV